MLVSSIEVKVRVKSSGLLLGLSLLHLSDVKGSGGIGSSSGSSRKIISLLVHLELLVVDKRKGSWVQ